ncbi:hypothetical protein COC42_10225 [Sphingomonas spermidinifaciens]|uniref:DUF2157 domain-containing protein n=1 Tax=Sphingomonas spermidinifaciens TaxID=1141889 RepID=A0A2A4B268_9SPHN|nr:hypothetical protein [Sphingomonas spermidinifaciens]PCD01879.1 hypothetical protein COC42_10225 [Sphingomonas spermidinifaciens]
MYSESDLDAAVTAGALSPAAALALRAHVAAQRNAPAVDEEHFRLLTGFNDIFVAVALALLLAAIAQIGAAITMAMGGVGVAVAAWLLAEYFTRRRRMALPSILLLGAFVGGVVAAPIGALATLEPNFGERINALILSGVGLLGLAAAWAHWRRFMVPITVAAGALALTGAVVGLAFAIFPGIDEAALPLVLAAGLAIFALAMRWDIRDRARTTRASDVAFWLHLAAAPLIAHPIFHLLGVFEGPVGPAIAALVIALYLGFAIVALAVDRRALLVSSLAYVLFALYELFRSAGAVELGAAFTGLVIGSALLTLSAFWQPMRRRVVSLLGEGMATRLPPATV